MLAGPEQARLLTEFENQFMEEQENTRCKQHEQGLSTQVLFQKHSNSFYETMMCMGNPFKDDCPELLALDSRNCANEDVITTVQKIKNIGVTQYQKHVSDVIVTRSVSIHQPIKKNSLAYLKGKNPK